jgi:hypothetical protein
MEEEAICNEVALDIVFGDKIFLPLALCRQDLLPVNYLVM